MSGFRKAKAEQAAVKLGMYGKAGTGKTINSLLFCEGLQKLTGKKTAFVDSERGTDFYCRAVKERKFHPEPFEFDALYTRSLTEALFEIKKLDPKEYGQLVIDCITHFWEAAMNAYDGKRTAEGGIPVHAWGKIKKPYKELFEYCMNSPMHFIICGRQGVTIYQDEDGETRVGGPKMKAEGETPHEPHVLFRTELKYDPTERVAIPTIFVEKDRVGVSSFKWIEWPTFENCIAPMLPYLSGTQGKQPSQEEAGLQDSEAITEAEKKLVSESGQMLSDYQARFRLAKSTEDVDTIAKEITPELKKSMVKSDVSELRVAWLAAMERFPKEKK